MNDSLSSLDSPMPTNKPSPPPLIFAKLFPLRKPATQYYQNQGGYGGPPQGQGYGGPPMQGGYGGPPMQQGGGYYPPQPQQAYAQPGRECEVTVVMMRSLTEEWFCHSSFPAEQ